MVWRFRRLGLPLDDFLGGSGGGGSGGPGGSGLVSVAAVAAVPSACGTPLPPPSAQSLGRWFGQIQIHQDAPAQRRRQGHPNAVKLGDDSGHVPSVAIANLVTPAS